MAEVEKAIQRAVGIIIWIFMAYMDKELYDQIVKDSPHLWWWVGDKKNLSIDSVVEGVLSNGDMDDVLRLFQILGREKVREVFLNQVSRPRNNYRPQTANFFRKLFAQNV